MRQPDSRKVSRRSFGAALAAAGTAVPLLSQNATPPAPNAVPQNTSVPRRRGLPPETPAFGETLQFVRKEVTAKVEPFRMDEVRLLAGPFKGSCPESGIGVEGLSIQGVPVRGVLRSTLMRHPSGAWLGGRRRCQTCRHWA